jgi:enamine deaminase RidA (YjgF/YER057c/UK114 family)
MRGIGENDSVPVGFHGARNQIMSAIHHIDVPDYPTPHSPFSHAVVANGFVFVSGQIPVKPGGGPTEIVGETMQEQTRQAMRNVQSILKAAGSSLERVVKITVLLARPDFYPRNERSLCGVFHRGEACAINGPFRRGHPWRNGRHRSDRPRLRRGAPRTRSSC